VLAEDHAGSRSLRSAIDDDEIECLLGAQEMARYVESGALTRNRHDWVVETGAAVDELSELIYAKQRLGGSAGSRRAGRLRDPGTAPPGRKSYRDRGRAHHGKLSRQARP